MNLRTLWELYPEEQSSVRFFDDQGHEDHRNTSSKIECRSVPLYSGTERGIELTISNDKTASHVRCVLGPSEAESLARHILGTIVK